MFNQVRALIFRTGITRVKLKGGLKERGVGIRNGEGDDFREVRRGGWCGPGHANGEDEVPWKPRKSRFGERSRTHFF